MTTHYPVELGERMARIESCLASLEAGQDQLRVTLSQLVSELKSRSDQQEARIRAIEIQQAQVQGVLAQRVEELETKLAALDKRTVEVELASQRVQPAVRIATWIAGVVGAAALMLLWALLTRQAQLVFK